MLENNVTTKFHYLTLIFKIFNTYYLLQLKKTFYFLKFFLPEYFFSFALYFIWGSELLLNNWVITIFQILWCL
jgi:hypothetical protein